MKKGDAKLAVLREYDRWAKVHPNDAKKMGGFVFFSYLQKEKPDLLDLNVSQGKSFANFVRNSRPLRPPKNAALLKGGQMCMMSVKLVML